MQKKVIEKTVKVTPVSPVSRLFKPVNTFLQTEASGGIILLIMALTAIIWANSPFYESYFAIWNKQIVVSYQGYKIDMPLVLWINDLLMAVFFFVVGLEIKRELIVGELSTVKKASLPIIAALGGMMMPALIYLSFNSGGQGENGWGIPVATDIAFSIGILSLLGNRVPVSLKVFLTAFAIADDIGAVIVIALFYTTKLSLTALFAVGLIVLLLMLVNALKIMRPVVYAALGIILWIAVYASGVHATIAGVLLIKLRMHYMKLIKVITMRSMYRLRQNSWIL
jgi:NhaA family Na+:H+ antiporter